MIKTFSINMSEEPKPEQIEEVLEAKKHPIVFDDDCPELTPEMFKNMKIVKKTDKISSDNTDIKEAVS